MPDNNETKKTSDDFDFFKDSDDNNVDEFDNEFDDKEEASQSKEEIKNNQNDHFQDEEEPIEHDRGEHQEQEDIVEEGEQSEEEFSQNEDLLEDDNFFDENKTKKKKIPRKTGKNGLELLEEQNDKRNRLKSLQSELEEETLEREYEPNHIGFEEENTEELSAYDQKINEQYGAGRLAAEIDDEIKYADEKQIKEFKKAEKLASEEANKRTREIYEHAHRHTIPSYTEQEQSNSLAGIEQNTSQAQDSEIKTSADELLIKQGSAGNSNSDIETLNAKIIEEPQDSSSALEIEQDIPPNLSLSGKTKVDSDHDVLVELSDEQPTTEDNISQKHNRPSDAFNMQRERIREYAPVSSNNERQVEQPASITEATGIEQKNFDSQYNTSSTNLLDNQDISNTLTKAIGADTQSSVIGTSAEEIANIDTAKNAASSLTNSASSLGTNITSSAASHSENTDEERNKQAKSVGDSIRELPDVIQYLNDNKSQLNAHPTANSLTGSTPGIENSIQEENFATQNIIELGQKAKEQAEKDIATNASLDKHNAYSIPDVVRLTSEYKQNIGPSSDLHTNLKNTKSNYINEKSELSSNGIFNSATGIENPNEIVRNGNKQIPSGAKDIQINVQESSAPTKKIAKGTPFSQKETRLNVPFKSTIENSILPAHSKESLDKNTLSNQLTSKIEPTYKRGTESRHNIRINGKEVSIEEETKQDRNINTLSSKNKSYIYDDKTGKIRLTDKQSENFSPDKHMRVSDANQIISSDEAIKRSRSVTGKGITKENLIIKNGDKLRISPHGVDNTSQIITLVDNGKIRVGRITAPGITSNGAIAGLKSIKGNKKEIKKEISVGSKREELSSRNSAKIESATQEYFRESAAKNRSIKLGRDGSEPKGRSDELLETVEENNGKSSRMNTSNTKRSLKAKHANEARIAKMNIGRSAKIRTASAGNLASSAEEAKNASRESFRFRRMWGLNIGATNGVGAGIDSATQATKKNAVKTIAKTATKKVLTASLATTLALGAGTAGQMKSASKTDSEFNDIYYLPQAHISSVYGNDSAPVITQNAVTKMAQRLSAYQILANGGTITDPDASMQNLKSISITSVTLNNLALINSGVSYDSIKDFSTNYLYSVSTTYPAYTETITIPEDESASGEVETKEVFIPAETLTATKNEVLSVGNVAVTFEYDDKDGNPINTGGQKLNQNTSSDSSSPTVLGDAGKILDAAKKRVGGKYKQNGNDWGNGASGTAVDDSHYVWNVLKEAGVYEGECPSATQWSARGKSVQSLEEAQAGDIFIYNNSHVAIYDGNGFLYEVKNASEGITHNRAVDYQSSYIIRRFISDGVGTKNPSQTNETEISIPNGLGQNFTYMGWQCIVDTGTAQYNLREEAGMPFDSEGFGTIDGRYVVACTSTFGKVGDFVDFYQSDGTVIQAIIGDVKNQSDAGCTKWGHDNGNVIVEFIVNEDTWYSPSYHSNPGTSSCHPEWGGKTITKAINLGNWSDDLISNANTALSSARKTDSKTYFLKEILAMSTLGGYYTSPADVDGYNQYCYDLMDYAIADWKGAEVAFTISPTGGTVTMNDGRSNVTAPEMQLTCNVIVHVCADLKTLEENDSHYGGVWQVDETEQGDALPYHLMQLESNAFDTIFNISTGITTNILNELPQEERKIYDFFKGKGFSVEVIAGIMANISRDSNFDATKISDEGRYGLFQWDEERFEKLKAYASTKGKEWSDVQCQLDYVWAEMSGDGSIPDVKTAWSKSIWNKFKKTTDESEAAILLYKKWESRSDATEANARGELAKNYRFKITGGTGSLEGYPDFTNMLAWGPTLNPYAMSGYYGQCTWFAWGRFYEIYGYSPGFTGNGNECADQLVAAHPDKFELSYTPKVGAIYSTLGHNHVGIVVGWDGVNITTQDGNQDGITNTFEDACSDWQTTTRTLSEFLAHHGGAKFAVPK